MTTVRAMLMLRTLPGVGDVRYRRLLSQYGSAESALDHATAEELGEPADAARRSGDAERRTDRALANMRRLGIRVLDDAHRDYPAALTEAAAGGRLTDMPRAPAMLFARGDLSLLERRWLAVVGTRAMTHYGQSVTRRFAGFLARSGEIVASGLARGIDGAAHQAALEAGRPTVAVTGCGLDRPYPREHVRLQERIAESGLLLSEQPPTEAPLRHHFIRRNGILAALSRGALVTEAPARSGALSTARAVRDLGGEVAAVPGPVGRPTAEGTNDLIRDGARFIADENDLVIAFGILRPASLRPTAAPTGSGPLWAALTDDARHVDELARDSGLGPADALAGLLQLELAGAARQLPGMRFVRASA